jgi:hypothetical protein
MMCTALAYVTQLPRAAAAVLQGTANPPIVLFGVAITLRHLLAGIQRSVHTDLLWPLIEKQSRALHSIMFFGASA